MKYKESPVNFKDPVCGMIISKLGAAATSVYHKKTYYFCAERCRDEFENDPQQYIALKNSKSNLKPE